MEMAESNKPTLALLPNRSEEDEINNNGETLDNFNLRRSNRIFKPPEQLGSVPYFLTLILQSTYLQDPPEKKHLSRD